MNMTRRKSYRTDDVTMTTEELLDSSPFDGDLSSELRVRPGGSGVSKLTLALGAGVILVAGILAGIQAQKMWGDGAGGGAVTVTSGGFAGAAQRAGGQGTRGGRTGTGPGGGATIGTVKLVDGDKIYVETVSGSTVTVTTSKSTKIQVSKQGKAEDLKPGSTVIVQGEQAEDGTVKANTVSESGAGGFRGFGTRNGG
ncbi:MAG TPA: hypothetical protein VIR33_11355 [Thermopolyspora sp.]